MGVRSVVTAVLDVAGLVAIPVGVGLLLGLGAALVVAGAAALFVSWRLSS